MVCALIMAGEAITDGTLRFMFREEDTPERCYITTVPTTTEVLIAVLRPIQTHLPIIVTVVTAAATSALARTAEHLLHAHTASLHSAEVPLAAHARVALSAAEVVLLAVAAQEEALVAVVLVAEPLRVAEVVSEMPVVDRKPSKG